MMPLTREQQDYVDERIAQAKREVLADVWSGIVPSKVKDFSALHSHVDANYYGGFFEDGVLDRCMELFPETDTGGWCDGANLVQSEIDAWIVDGSMRTLAKDLLQEDKRKALLRAGKF